MFRIRFNISLLASVIFAASMLFATGCPSSSNDALQILTKMTSIIGCQGCDPADDKEEAPEGEEEYTEDVEEPVVMEEAPATVEGEAESEETEIEPGEGESNEGEVETAEVEGEERAKHVILLPGDISLDLIWIPGGIFLMGSDDNEEKREEDEGPRREVTLTQGFWMGMYEVTQAQWQALMNSNPSCFKGASLPVGGVSWNEAQGFITALNAYVTSSGQGPSAVRLPSEAEWEYACRAGTTTRYYWGDDLDYAQVDACAWHAGNSACNVYPGGTKLPNAFGLCDMSGNVFEWCQDWYGPYPTEPQTNPVGPVEGSHRILRGGSLKNEHRYCRSANRGGGEPDTRCFNLGFRIVADFPPVE